MRDSRSGFSPRSSRSISCSISGGITFFSRKAMPRKIFVVTETIEQANTVLGFFTRGGLFMWPLLACSIVSVTTMILRGMALREKNVMPPLIEHEIERLEPGENPERLSRIVHHDHSSLARITRVALQHLRSPRSENVEVVQTRARHEMVRLEKGLIILEVIV